jgi:hypothetical protein
MIAAPALLRLLLSINDFSVLQTSARFDATALAG